jgi:hypothetical protein
MLACRELRKNKGSAGRVVADEEGDGKPRTGYARIIPEGRRLCQEKKEASRGEGYLLDVAIVQWDSVRVAGWKRPTSPLVFPRTVLQQT